MKVKPAPIIAQAVSIWLSGVNFSLLMMKSSVLNGTANFLLSDSTSIAHIPTNTISTCIVKCNSVHLKHILLWMFRVEQDLFDAVKSESRNHWQDVKRMSHVGNEINCQWMRSCATHFVAISNNTSIDTDKDDVTIVSGQQINVPFGDVKLTFAWIFPNS